MLLDAALLVLMALSSRNWFIVPSPHLLLQSGGLERRHDDVFDIYSAQFCLPQSSSEQELPTLFGLLEEQPAILPLEHQVLIATLRSEGRLYGTTLGWFVIMEGDDRICALKIEKHQILDILYLYSFSFDQGGVYMHEGMNLEKPQNWHQTEFLVSLWRRIKPVNLPL